MDRSKLLESFDFDNDKVLHNQVQPIGAIELDAAVGERDGALFFNFETASPQLEDQASNVSGFQQSGSQRSMTAIAAAMMIPVILLSDVSVSMSTAVHWVCQGGN